MAGSKSSTQKELCVNPAPPRVGRFLVVATNDPITARKARPLNPAKSGPPSSGEILATDSTARAYHFKRIRAKHRTGIMTNQFKRTLGRKIATPVQVSAEVSPSLGVR